MSNETLSPTSQPSKINVPFSGAIIETTVTHNPSVAEEWIQHILLSTPPSINRPLVVGLDCEWRPHYIRTLSNKVATLQLCTNNKCLILQLFYMPSIPRSLKTFLGNINITFVGVGVEDDVLKLRDYYGLHVSKSVDIREVAIERGYRAWSLVKRQPGLKDIAWEVAGLRMEKPIYVTRSNWEAKVLSPEQIQYACIDAYASYKIGCKLLT